MFDFIAEQMSRILFMFPESPFQKITLMLDDVKLLNYLNWVVPFDSVMEITALWLAGILAWKVWGFLYLKITTKI